MLFEIVSSVDNAVINAEVLETLPSKDRRWFLRWGLLFSVLVVRGVLPWFIIWLALPGETPLGAFTASVQPGTDQFALHNSASFLLLISGTALTLLFWYWFLMEHKNTKRGHLARLVGFLVVGVVFLLALIQIAADAALYKAIFIGLLLFFVLLVVKQLAAFAHRRGKGPTARNAKIIYLEVIDTIFSIEGVLGAFAFTFYVPYILIGNGVGAVIVRLITAKHGRKIQEMTYIKHGAMYALCFIGVIMILEGLGAELPGWLTLLTTTVAMAFAYLNEGRK
jgi:hypothetical protein